LSTKGLSIPFETKRTISIKTIDKQTKAKGRPASSIKGSPDVSLIKISCAHKNTNVPKAGPEIVAIPPIAVKIIG
jgi:hypothetical protein